MALVAASAMSVPAQATWMEATSKHFVVYSDTKEADLRTLATRLEQFDALMRHLTNVPDDADASANRVTVYVAPGGVDAVDKLCGKACGGVAGFYVPRVDGSVVFTPRRTDAGSEDGFKPQLVLFHEYAHHFLLGNFTAAYPAWFSEGYAEFVSTVSFDGEWVQLGRAAQHRAYGVFNANGMSAAALFASGNKRLSEDQRQALYGRGWLLTHYFMFDRTRNTQFHAYLKAVNDGTPSAKAAVAAFGDMRDLDHAIDRYVSRPTLPAMKVALSSLPAGMVTIRPLSPGQSALMLLRMRSERGVGDADAKPLYARALKAGPIATDDAVAQGWLAEMAFDAGDDAAAEAAAERSFAADPKSAQALLYKARIHMRRALAAKSVDPVTWKEARDWIIRANALDHNNAEALALYYDSFEMQNIAPSKSAIAGVRRAAELVPQDPGLRWTMARQAVVDGDIEGARVELRPLAYDPHAEPDNAAAQLITILDSGKTGREALAALDATRKKN